MEEEGGMLRDYTTSYLSIAVGGIPHSSGLNSV
jgi:hypothetical protein